MGEAKRRKVLTGAYDARRQAYDTWDDGPPSDAKIALVIDIFDPLQAMFGDIDGPRITTIATAVEKHHQHPTPLCGACDYEFAFGEPPSLVYCVRPFIPKAPAHMIISGSICLRCAASPPDEMLTRLRAELHKFMPSADFSIGQIGTA
jgi:hypothetical protein